MSFLLGLGLVIAAYAAILSAVLYFSVFADPDESPTAAFLTEALPQKVWTVLGRCVGRRGLAVVQFFADRVLMVIYIAVVGGAWTVVFWYVYPWLDRQTYVSKAHKIIGYGVCLLCVSSWRLASTSSPGIITKHSLHRYQHFAYDHILFEPGQVCKTRKIPKLARSKFDRYKFQQNIPRFDHFCGWVYNTIGEENYRWFLWFLFVHVLMCLYGTFVLWHLFVGEIQKHNLLQVTFVDRFTGEEIPASKWIVLQFLFNRYLVESAVFLLMAVMAVALGMFLMYHMYLTSYGMTTNESYKWGYVNKWYKSELKRYNAAVRAGIIDPSTTKPLPKVGDDGNVTCTPSAGASELKGENENVIAHPGPKPRNIYDRGLRENWKEVLFPISLREDRHIEWHPAKSKDS